MNEVENIQSDWGNCSVAGHPIDAVACGETLGHGPHLDALTRAISNVLSTQTGAETFAQIIDGLPLAHVSRESPSSHIISAEHPLKQKHETLCAGVLEHAQRLRQTLKFTELRFRPKLLATYDSAAPGSRMFYTRLIELTAIGVHEIAVQLFNRGSEYHPPNDPIRQWVPPKDHIWWEYYNEPWPTFFRHPWYKDHDQYPHGLADMAGYWAEARFLGGVVLFDRRDPNSAPPREAADIQPDSIWLHPDHCDSTYSLVRLTDDQKLEFLRFITSDNADPDILPLRIGQENVVREDPEERLEDTGIYRDLWERRQPPWEKDRRLRDRVDMGDYPTKADLYRARERAYVRKSRELGWELSDFSD